MSDSERKKVKKVANEPLETLKRKKLVLDWLKKEMTRAAVRQTIEFTRRLIEIRHRGPNENQANKN